MSNETPDEAKTDDGGQVLASFGDDASSGKPDGETMDGETMNPTPDDAHDASVQPVTTHRQQDDGSIAHD